MASNTIVIGSKFKPFSYAELLQPVARATQTHQEIENQYSEFASKANVWENLANEQNDPQTYAMYKRYSEDLNKQAELLSKQGLNPQSRQSMLDLKNRYSSEIVPIEQAFTRRRQLADEQRKAMLSDHTLLFDKRADQMSLDTLIQNPELQYESYSGKMLSAQVAQAATQLTKDIQSDPNKWKPIIGGQYMEILRQRGFRTQDVLDVLSNNEKASPILKKLLNDVVESTNIPNWEDPNLLEQAYKHAGTGLYHAVGDAQYDRLANRGWEARQAENIESQSPPLQLFERLSNITPLDKDTSDISKELKFINSFKNKNGQMDINKLEEQLTKESNPVSNTRTFKTPFSHIEYNPQDQNNSVEVRLNDLYKKYGTTNITDIESMIVKEYETTAKRSTTMVSKFIPEHLHEAINNTLFATANANNEILAFDYSKGKKGDKLTADELSKSKFVGQLEFSAKNGIIMTLKDSNDKIRKVQLDPAVIDNGTGEAYFLIDNYKKSIGNGDDEMAKKYFRSIENMIHGKVETPVPGVPRTDKNAIPMYVGVNESL